MPYEELSSLPGGSTGNANEKQGPKALPASAFGKTSAPTSEVIQERPNYIFVNNTGSYAFSFNPSASVGGTHTDKSSYSTGSVRFQRSDIGQVTPIELHVNPKAWRRTDASSTVGDITFVYKGGL